jgi:gluconolactonase
MIQLTPDLTWYFQLYDDAFADVLGPAPRLERVVMTDAHEGPVYAADEHALYFTTGRPFVAIRRLGLADRSITTLRAATHAANGMAMGRDGRLLVCEQGSMHEPAAITAVDRPTGATETVVDAWHGLPLNSPNDIAVARDGTIWFTDPSYGHLQGFRPPPAVRDRVYRLDPRTRELWVAADGFDKPNGLALSPDESTLYVGDNGAPHRLYTFEVTAGRTLRGRRELARLPAGHPDGVKVDAAGRIYVSAPDGVRVFDPAGRLLGAIRVPFAVNFTFGAGALYVTCDTAIWAASLAAAGG